MRKVVILAAASAILLSGCASDGSFCPPDPLGRAVFTYFHKKAEERRASMQQSDQAMMNQQEQDTQYLHAPTAAGGSTGHLPREYPVTTPRPPLQNEAQPPAPGYANPVWIDGYWKWNGSSWTWQPGRWAQRPRSGAEWISAQYYTSNGQGYWRDGYWK